MKKIKILVLMIIIFTVLSCLNVYAQEWPIEKYNNNKYLFKVSNYTTDSNDQYIKGEFTTEYIDKDGKFDDPGYIINYGTSVAKQVIEYTYTLPTNYAELKNYNDSTEFEFPIEGSDLIDISRASNAFSVTASFVTYKNEEELQDTIDSVLSYEFDNSQMEETNIGGKRAIKATGTLLREPIPDVFGNLEYEETVEYFVVMDQFKVNGSSLLLCILLEGNGSTLVGYSGGQEEVNSALLDYYNWHKEAHADIVRELAGGELTYQLKSFKENGKDVAVGSITDNISGETKEKGNGGIIAGTIIVGGIAGGVIIIRLKNKKLKNENTELSESSKKIQKEYKESIAKAEHDAKVDRIKYKHGLDKNATDTEVKKHLVKERVKNEVEFQNQMEKEENLEAAQNTAESIESAADYTMAVGEAMVPGGKVVSATYKGLKSVAATTADKGIASGLTEGVIRGATDAATTMMDGGIKKATTAFAGETAANVIGAGMRGENIERAVKEGIAKGAVNASTGVLSDTLGDAAGDVGSAIGNVASTAYSKNVSDSRIKENLDKTDKEKAKKKKEKK